MTTATRPRALCVDDEPMVLEGLRLHLRRRFDLVTALSGAEGLEALQSQGPFAVIVSDMRMPGMSGAEFLARARVVAPDSVRVLLTGHSDFSAALQAVNEGQLFRFLTKPCPPEVMISTLEAAAEQHRLVHAERVLLEQTLTGAIRTLSEVLSLANPIAFGRGARLHRSVSALAKQLQVKDRWPVEVAAQLSQIGAIQLQPQLAEKLYFGLPLTPAEQKQAERVPALADQLLGNIPRLEPVREILAHQTRRFDGSDDPLKRTRGEAIPLGARMLKAAVDLDTLQAGGMSGPQAIATMRSREGWYDPSVLEALSAVVGEETETEIRELPLAAVQPGMVLAADVRAHSGILLVARGFTVSTGLLGRLQGIAGGVQEPLRVIVSRGAETRTPGPPSAAPLPPARGMP